MSVFKLNGDAGHHAIEQTQQTRRPVVQATPQLKLASQDRGAPARTDVTTGTEWETF